MNILSQFKFKNKSKVTVNGKTYEGNQILICNDSVIVDGKKTPKEITPEITINVFGDADDVFTTSGNINVRQNAGNITTSSGDIKCRTVLGSIETNSGDVSCKKVSGSIRTSSGDVHKSIF